MCASCRHTEPECCALTGFAHHVLPVSCVWLCTLAAHAGSGVLAAGSHRLYTCPAAGRQQDMQLMRGHGQLADMYLCLSRVPALAKVPCPPHPSAGVRSRPLLHGTGYACSMVSSRCSTGVVKLGDLPRTGHWPTHVSRSVPVGGAVCLPVRCRQVAKQLGVRVYVDPGHPMCG